MELKEQPIEDDCCVNHSFERKSHHSETVKKNLTQR